MLFEWHTSILISGEFIRKENFRCICGAFHLLKVINNSDFERPKRKDAAS